MAISDDALRASAVSERVGSYFTEAGAARDGWLASARDSSAVSGLTHTYYRYPARFSPKFVRACIEAFTRPGDCVLDPFVGGGTTLVEALALGRHGIGTDISALASFVSSVKTTLMSEGEIAALVAWLHIAKAAIGANEKGAVTQEAFADDHYKRNLGTADTWRLRKAVERAVGSASRLKSERLESFARCVVLRAAQWAIDGRRELPTIPAFKVRLDTDLREMLAGHDELAGHVARHRQTARTICLNRTAVGLDEDPAISLFPRPKLVLTSPPYPGVHVLYHRWQVNGGKETPVPFWIAKQLDGKGASFYTMGDRKEADHETYFKTIGEAFSSVASLCDPDATIIQMVAFSSPEKQLPRYLAVMHASGLRQSVPTDQLTWRTVPNRRWHAEMRGATTGSREVVLVHKLARN